MNGLEANNKALKLQPDLKIIALTVFSKAQYYTLMIDIDAKGFLLKSSGFNELENAIRIVMKGESYFSNKSHKEIDTEVQSTKLKVNVDSVIRNNYRKEKMMFFPWVVNMKTV